MTVTRPATITPTHWQEWLESAVDPGIIARNVRSVQGEEVTDLLLTNELEQILKESPDSKYYATGPVKRLFERYASVIEHGGWWCAGVDPVEGSRMDWGQLKSEHSRIADRYNSDAERWEAGKAVKYEPPKRTPTRLYALDCPSNIWQRIAEPIRRLVINGWQEVWSDPKIPVVITEGAKKGGAILTAGWAAIALPGVTSGYRLGEDHLGKRVYSLIPDIAAMKLKGRTVYLAFDQDTKASTRRKVSKALIRFGELLQKAGARVFIVTWHPELGKGADDLIAAHGAEVFARELEQAQELHLWQTQRWRELTYQPSALLNRRYLGDLEVPSHARLIAIKSAKGTGKTHSMAVVYERCREEGRPTFVLTHRVQLGQSTCDRIGLNYVTEIWDKNGEGRIFGFGLCVDSMHPNSQARFSAEHWKDPLVIIDEAEQVIWHMLNSYTCRENRVAILEEFRTLMENALDTHGCGQVILADADLTDLSIKFVSDMAGVVHAPWVIVNQWKPEVAIPGHYYEQPDAGAWLQDLEQAVMDGQKLFVCLSAQQEKSLLSAQNLEQHLSHFGHRKILRIDSVTVADPNHSAYCCIGKLNEILPQYDIVLATPAIETGVSIDVKHFDSVWGCFQGVQTDDSVRQALARVREPIPRYIWVKEYGALGRVGNGSTSIRSLLASQQKLVKANLQQLLLDGIDDLDTDWSLAALQTWAKMAARVNGGMLRYRESVRRGLEAEGYELTRVDGGGGPHAWEKIKEVRDVRQDATVRRWCSAPLKSDAEYSELKKKRQHTEEELDQIKRYEIERRYLQEITPELARKDSDGWHSQIQLHYYLSLGKAFLKTRDRGKLRPLVYKAKLWIPDANKAVLTSQVGLLELLGVFKWLQPGRNLRSTDPDLIATAELFLSDPWTVKAVLGISVAPTSTPIQIAQRIAGKLGLTLSSIKREGPRDQRQRVYQIEGFDDGRQDVFERWLARDQAQVEEVVSTLGNKSGFTTTDTDSETNTESVPNSLNGRPQKASWEVGQRVSTHFGAGVIELLGDVTAIVRSIDGSDLTWTAAISELQPLFEVTA